MKNDVMARNYFEQGKCRAEWVEKQFAAGHWPIVVREAQECVELLVKGALRLVGIEVPRTHDPAEMLKRNAHRFPPAFKANIPALADACTELAGWRGPSFYGDETANIPPGELFGPAQAQQAAGDVRVALRACESLFGEEN